MIEYGFSGQKKACLESPIFLFELFNPDKKTVDTLLTFKCFYFGVICFVVDTPKLDSCVFCKQKDFKFSTLNQTARTVIEQVNRPEVSFTLRCN